MRHNQRPRSIHEHISTQQVGQELLVYDETSHKAFCLNATSAAVWKRCDGTHTIRQIASGATLELAAPVTEEIVLFALSELRADGLVEADDLTGEVVGMSRRQLVQRLGVGAAMLVPVVAAVMAPPAAQAYSGCFDCNAVHGRGQRSAPTPTPTGPSSQIANPSLFQ